MTDISPTVAHPSLVSARPASSPLSSMVAGTIIFATLEPAFLWITHSTRARPIALHGAVQWTAFLLTAAAIGALVGAGGFARRRQSPGFRRDWLGLVGFVSFVALGASIVQLAGDDLSIRGLISAISAYVVTVLLTTTLFAGIIDIGRRLVRASSRT